MDYRIGKCSQCGAEYKVPASFAHDVARCKVCQGVVHLGAPGAPAPSGAPAQAPVSEAPKIPARKVVPNPAAAAIEEVKSEDADRKRSERGTLARLKAERAAAAAATGSAPKPAPAPAPAPAADDFGSEFSDDFDADLGPVDELEAEPEPVAAKAEPEEPKKATARGAGARTRGGAASRGKSSRSSGRKREAKPKKKSPLVPIMAILVVGGAVAAFFFIQKGDDDSATPSEVSAADTSATGPEGTAPPTPEELAPEPEEVVAADPEPEVEVEPKAPALPKGDPASIDLTALGPFDRARGTTDEEWTEMNEWMATFMDPEAGAAGNRAGGKLENMGRKAFPVLVNHMLTLDYSIEQGYRDGDICQKKLQAICNGSNFNWRYSTSTEDEYFNKKATELWAKTWMQVETDIEAFIKAAKLENKDPAEAKRLRDLYGKGSDDAEPAAASDGMDDDLDID